MTAICTPSLPVRAPRKTVPSPDQMNLYAAAVLCEPGTLANLKAWADFNRGPIPPLTAPAPEPQAPLPAQPPVKPQPDTRRLSDIEEGERRRLLDGFYSRHRNGIYRYAVSLAHHDQDAEDLLMEGFLRAAKGNAEVVSFPVYWKRCVLNLYRDQCRRSQKVRFQSADCEGWEEGGEFQIADDRPTPSEQLETLSEKELLVRAVRRNLSRLSPDHQFVIIQHHLLGRELKDIAREMGCCIGTVKSRVHRARHELAASSLAAFAGA